MSTAQLSETDLQMRLYYQNAFPFDLMAKWLVYGRDGTAAEPKKDPKQEEDDTAMVDSTTTTSSSSSQLPYFKNREFCCVYKRANGKTVVVRFRSFKDGKEMRDEFVKSVPARTEIGAIYSKPLIPSNKGLYVPQERELIFDIDMNDFDSVRYCCKDKAVCNNCWPLATTAAKVINHILRECFGFKHLLWVFSGRRGIHCWVADKRARCLTPEAREAIIDFMNILNSQCPLNEVMPDSLYRRGLLHPAIGWCYDNVIKKFFEGKYLGSQKLLTDPDRQKDILSFFVGDAHDSLAHDFSTLTETPAMWETLLNHCKDGSARRIPQRIAFTYTYPRFDANVTKGINHLLKSPFSVHPDTGMISVPIDFDKIDEFDVKKVPTLKDVVTEIGEKGSSESLKPYLEVFSRFVNAVSEDPEQRA